MLSWQKIEDLEASLEEERLCSLRVIFDGDYKNCDILIIRHRDLKKAQLLIKEAYDKFNDAFNKYGNEVDMEENFGYDSIFSYYPDFLDERGIDYQICEADVCL